MRRAAIAGIGSTEYSRAIGRSDRALACEAVRAALIDAGLDAEAVDGVVCSNLDTTDETELNRNLGFGDLRFFAQLPGGGGAAAGLIGLAAMAIGTGQANVVVAYRSRKRGSGPRPWATGMQFHEGAGWLAPHGLLRPVDEVALWSRRYLSERGVSRDQLGMVAVTFRTHAQANPGAQMQGRTLSLQDYLESRWISEPLCLFDCSLESDGAAAVVVASSELARDLRHRLVEVAGFAQGISADYQPMANAWAADPLRQPSDVAGAALWEGTGVGPGDVDVAQIYDGFSPMVLKALESYGFCPPGDLGGFLADGNLALSGGALPTNTSGGGLSEANIHGMNLVVEAVHQLRGTANLQVHGAEVCFVSAAALAQTSALVLTAP